MTDSTDATVNARLPAGHNADPEPNGTPSWLLMIHHLPPKPDYLRVKVRRRLERLGALAVKNSVYVLPHRPDTLEDFHWLAREIVSDGGEVTICTAAFISGTRDDGLVASFQAARATDYAEIAEAAGALDRENADVGLARLVRRFTAVADIDHFESPTRRDAELALNAAESRLHGPRASPRTVAARPADAVSDRRWITRAGVFVDRIASAWLIRRFIDPAAHFAFVSDARFRPGPGDVRFDMFDAEYTHEGDRCTFEVLLSCFGLEHTALVTIAEIVHDIDLKDEKYGRPETPGVHAVLAGIASMTKDDDERLERGGALFDGLYATLGGAFPDARP